MVLDTTVFVVVVVVGLFTKLIILDSKLGFMVIDNTWL